MKFDFKIFQESKNKYLIIHCLTILITTASIFIFNLFYFQIEQIAIIFSKSFFGVLFVNLILIILIFRILFYCFLFYNYLKYKFILVKSDELLPNCSIIIPAFNEGKFVYDTLLSISQSNYPFNKLEVIVIDDGSTDNTYNWIEKADNTINKLFDLKIIRFYENRGKKEALIEGFSLANGEIFVTIDSDSVIEKDSLRNLVAPFIFDEKCGVVAGNVKVYNLQNTIFPKMLNVSFAFNFGFIRAAQSNMNSVLCSPGAFSAFRSSVVKLCLESWLNQEFLGVKTKIGEDRALTNLIIKSGYKSLFQKNALVYTKVPTMYKTLKNMLIRWERGDIRENIIMTKFIFKNFRNFNLFHIRIISLNQLISNFLAIPLFLIMIIMCFYYPRLFISSSILSTCIISIGPALYYAYNVDIKKSFWIFSYNIFYAFFLFWIIPYSILTLKKGNWLTR